MCIGLIRRSRTRGTLAVMVTFAAALALVCALLASSVASAHVVFQGSDPVANSTVPTAPTEVKVQFDGEISSSGSTLTVTGPDGQPVDNGDAHLDLNNLNRDTIVCTLKPDLGPGTYTVSYAGTPTDGHEPATGSYTFTVAGGPAMAGATPGATPVGTPIATPAATPIAKISGSTGSGSGVIHGDDDTYLLFWLPVMILAAFTVGGLTVSLRRRSG